MSLKSKFKGWVGEKAAQFGMWAVLDSGTYKRFHNIILPAGNGFTEIDHLIVSRYGIFVVETKNYDGIIYADEKSSKWTQYLKGKKSVFMNPLHQNYKHCKAVEAFLNLPEGTAVNIVMFIGEAEFKTELPENVFNGGSLAYIRSFTEEVFRQIDVDKFCYNLEKVKNTISKQEHKDSLEIRFNSLLFCPKCSGKLVERTIAKGVKAGEKFVGCSNFPKCRYTRDKLDTAES